MTGAADAPDGAEAEQDTFAGYQVFAARYRHAGWPSCTPCCRSRPTSPTSRRSRPTTAVLDEWARGRDRADRRGDRAARPGARSGPTSATQRQARDAASTTPTGCARRPGGWRARAHGALQTRVHGDFHLGQVLVVQGDAYIIDFEGEPARHHGAAPGEVLPAARRGRAAALVRLRRGRGGAGPRRRLRAGRRSGGRPACWSSAPAPAPAFLEAYRAVLESAEPRWVPPEAEAALLDLFLLEKAAYEIKYEAANRPDLARHPARRHVCASPNACSELGAAGMNRARSPRSSKAGTATRSRSSGRTVDGGRACASSCPAPTASRCIDRGRQAARRAAARASRRASSRRRCRRAAPTGCASDARHHATRPRTRIAFGPTLGDLDLHLLAEGRHRDLGLRARRALGRVRRRRRRALRGLGAERAPRLRGRRLQRLGRRRGTRCASTRRRRLGLFMPGVAARRDLQIRDARPARRASAAEGRPGGVARPRCRPRPPRSSPAPLQHAWTDADWLQRRRGAQRRARRSRSTRSMPRPGCRRPSWAAAAGTRWPTGWRRTAPGSASPISSCCRSWSTRSAAPGATSRSASSRPSSRLGPPDGFARFVDRCHAMGVGVILDWVPAHFPTDAHGLARFDGTPLYEHADPREGFHRDWNT